jgi:predicted porin
MKTKAISIAVLGMTLSAAAASALAQTNVTLMGTVDMFAGSLKNSGDAGRRAVVNSGGMTTSWFGVKGSEDLGGGMKAEMALTGFFQGDTGASGRFGGDTFFSRDASIALAGNFGRVQLGRGVAPSFLPTVLFNPFGDSFTFSPLVVHTYVPSGNFGARTWPSSVAGDSGWSNQVIYTTPSFGGLKANLHYQFGEVAGDNSVRNVALNVLYFNGPLGLFGFWQNVKDSNPVPGGAIVDATAAPINYRSINRQTAWSAGGSYDLKTVKLYATYRVSDSDTATASSAMKDKTWSLGLGAPVGAGTVMLGYANTARSGSLVGADVKRDTFTAGYDYNLSKRTDLYAMLMSDKITIASREESIGLGIRHRF